MIAGVNLKQPLARSGEASIKPNFLALIVASLLLVIVFLAVGMMTGSGDLSLIEPSEDLKMDAAVRQRATAIGQLNQGLPRDLGNGTQLDKILADDDGLYYQFSLIELSSDEVDAADLSQLSYESSRPRVCSQPQIWKFRNTEFGFIESEYRSSDGIVVMTVRIEKSNCE
jgi:hypothetical protein